MADEHTRHGEDAARPARDSPHDLARERLRQQHAGTPTDVGRTSGGGSLGHKQPPDVTRESPIRNQPPDDRLDR